MINNRNFAVSNCGTSECGDNVSPRNKLICFRESSGVRNPLQARCQMWQTELTDVTPGAVFSTCLINMSGRVLSGTHGLPLHHVLTSVIVYPYMHCTHMLPSNTIREAYEMVDVWN